MVILLNVRIKAFFWSTKHSLSARHQSLCHDW